MDFAEGGTLADKTPEGKYKYLPMKEEDVLQVVKETVNAFDFCHSKGIVHRDIKPGNLFYKNADGSDILVGDFGISSEVDLEGGMSKRMTTTSRTEGYAAPEIYSGVIGKEIDYYALGITVYELLTGKNPFAGRNDMHIMRDTIQGRVAEDLITRPEANSFSNRTKKLIQGLLTVRHEKRWGLLEVNRFLKGEDVPVAENLIKEIPAFTFGSKKYTDYVELSLALQEDRESAKKMLYRGNITRWAEGFDNDFAIKMGDIVEKYSKTEEQEFGLIQLMFLLNPERSCKLDSGRSLKTFEELRNLLLENGDSLVKDLQNEFSELHAWLMQNNLKEIVGIVKEQNKLGLSNKKYVSNLQVSITEGFQPKNEKISLFVLSDILSLSDSDKQKIFNWSLDKDSYFSAWFEIKGDKGKYDIWWSGKVTKDFDHWKALISEMLVYFKQTYFTKDLLEKYKREIETNEIESLKSLLINISENKNKNFEIISSIDKANKNNIIFILIKMFWPMIVGLFLSIINISFYPFAYACGINIFYILYLNSNSEKMKQLEEKDRNFRENLPKPIPSPIYDLNSNMQLTINTGEYSLYYNGYNEVYVDGTKNAEKLTVLMKRLTGLNIDEKLWEDIGLQNRLLVENITYDKVKVLSEIFEVIGAKVEIRQN
jgi:serine/threonine protein kinase